MYKIKMFGTLFLELELQFIFRISCYSYYVKVTFDGKVDEYR